MAYKQSPANVLKGQMKNKAAGLMLKDSESGLMMMGAKTKKKPEISTGRKILNTAGQFIKDVGYQARDLITPDPKRMPASVSRKDNLNMQILKNQEQKNYDTSRARVKKGETYFSVADAFDDSGYGSFTGLGKKAKRKDKGSFDGKGVRKASF
tara:strand:+ start:1541 stop:1999 length:459 start_codon:yes stop_codon:yes gene_type:complete